MQADQLYNEWLEGKRRQALPYSLTESIMNRIEGESRTTWLDQIADHVEQYSELLWVRIVAITSSMFVCLLRLIVLFLAILG